MAPMPGTVVRVSVGVGDRVPAGAEVCVIEAMKMESSITADGAGEVAGIHVEVGAAIDAGQLLVTLRGDTP